MNAADLLMWVIVVITMGGSVVGAITIAVGVVSLNTSMFLSGAWILLVCVLVGFVTRKFTD